jgi:protein TonB
VEVYANLLLLKTSFMEVNKILSSDLLDILFDGRNKDYGAYNLRRGYNKSMIKAMGIMVCSVLVLVTGYLFANKVTGDDLPFVKVTDIELVSVHPPEPEKEFVLPPKPAPELPKIATIKNVVPIIVNDKDVPADQMPPEISELVDARIGLVTSAGVKDDYTTAPPIADDRRDVIMVPKSGEGDEKIFYKVEIESLYPGGAGAWMRYLKQDVQLPAGSAGK